MRTIIWLLYLIFFLLITIPVLIWMKLLDAMGKSERRQHIVDKWVPLWAKSLCWLAGAKVTVSGLENLPTGGYLLMSNHQSYFDIPVLLAATGIPFGFVAKSSVHYIPIIGSWMRRIHCVSINRDDPRGAMATLLDSCVSQLHAGHPVCIFPEGTRSAGGEIKPFKKGGFVTAEHAKAPIIPVVIEGTYGLWETSPTGIHPADVMVTFLPAVCPAEMEEQERATLPLTLRKTMVAQRARMRAQLLQKAIKEQNPQSPNNPQEPWRTTHAGNLDGDNH